MQERKDLPWQRRTQNKLTTLPKELHVKEVNYYNHRSVLDNRPKFNLTGVSKPASTTTESDIGHLINPNYQSSTVDTQGSRVGVNI